MKMLTNKERDQVFFLNVPFEEIEEAKDFGAQWDKEYKKWYVPLDIDKQIFSKWFGTTKDFLLPKSSLESPLLYVDLVPTTTWYSNLYKTLKKKDWDNIRKSVYTKANNKCEICEGIGKNGRLDAHERWEYDDVNRIQILKEISCLCPKCHRTTHIGFAGVLGLEAQATRHLKWINKWSRSESTSHIGTALKKWKERSNHEWVVDVTWLKNCGIDISPKSLSLLKTEKNIWVIRKKIKT